MGINLLSNAIKFTAAGNVSLEVLAAGDDLPEDLTMAPGNLALIVRDTGPGVPLEAQAQLFSAFTQADASTTRRFGGSGLGLAITRQLAELMGGQTGFASRAGEGAVFWVIVPCPPAPQPDATLPIRRLTGRQVLLVLPEGILCDHLRDLLLATGAEVAVALEPPAELAIYDLVIAEPSVYRALPARRTPQLRVVLATAAGPSAVLQAAGECDGQLVKPVFRRDLLPLLDRLFGGGDGKPAATVGSDKVFPYRILLVEDNETNRQIAEILLGRLGCRVRSAVNGREALEAIRAGIAFDLVFMDCQMPEMDGYEATRAIRDWEGVRRAAVRLPIVALTANAMQGDDEACRAAGMDDYLPKPFKQEQLMMVLERHLGATRVAAAGPSPQTPVAEAASGIPSFDRSVLENFLPHGDRVGPTARRLLTLFLRETERQLDEMERAEGAGDDATVQRLAHTLKSASASIGALVVAEAAKAVELQIRNQTPQRSATIGQIRAAFAECRRAMANAAPDWLEPETMP